MKYISLIPLLLLLALNSNAAIFKSDTGFKVELDDDWLPLGKQQISAKFKDETLKSLKLIGINDKKFEALLQRIKEGNVEFIFDKKYSTKDFNNNISLQKGVGATARTKKQADIICKTIGEELKKLYKKDIKVIQCGLKTIGKNSFMSYEYSGALTDITTIQHEFQLTPNVTLITVGGSLPAAVNRVQKTQQKIASAITDYIKKSPDYFSVMAKATKALKNKKYKSAYKQYKILASVGDPEGVFNIARFLEHGKGTKKDLKKSLLYYQKAARSGSRLAITKLGDFFMNGKGTKKDLPKAAKLFYQAGLMGDPVAQHIFATMLFNGIGLKEKNQAEAVKWLKESAKQGYPPAAKSLFELFESGVKNKQPGSQHGLAMLYLQGVGVKKDTAKALKLLEKSAFNGAKASRVALFEIYTKGMFGIPKNPEKAKMWKSE
ncbi:MAG: sel1 repeat family protein [Gammaproteobacteria bacterium]|nr:sel1 repeat family protein [Gammaproteobacteria bacterium]